MSFEELAVEGIYAERGVPERPTFSPKAAPCDTCEHATRCGKELLACCAYARHVGCLTGHRSLRREPSAAWYAFVETDGPMPKCTQCGAVGKVNRNIRELVIQVLQEAPGSSAKAIARAAGVSRKSAKSALERLRESGQAEIIGYCSSAHGGPQWAMWRLK